MTPAVDPNSIQQCESIKYFSWIDKKTKNKNKYIYIYNQNNKKPLQTSSKKFPNSFSQYFDISKELLTYGYQPTINIESWIKIKINRKKYEKKTKEKTKEKIQKII